MVTVEWSCKHFFIIISVSFVGRGMGSWGGVDMFTPPVKSCPPSSEPVGG